MKGKAGMERLLMLVPLAGAYRPAPLVWSCWLAVVTCMFSVSSASMKLLLCMAPNASISLDFPILAVFLD